MATDKQPLTIRLEENILYKIKLISEIERRSQNSQIEIALEKYIADYEKEHGSLNNFV